MNPPLFAVIAGANGAGKSTITGGKPEEFISAQIIDPDAIARHIQVSRSAVSDIAAAKEALSQITQLMNKRHSLAIETTLSGKGYLRMMEEARLLSYTVMLVYVGTDSVEINLSRIVDRVSRGLHDVPEADVRRRYKRSLENLPRAVQLADVSILLDNSSPNGYDVVGVSHGGQMEWNSEKEIPIWASSLV